MRISIEEGQLVLLPRFSSIRHAIKVITEQILVERYHVKKYRKKKVTRPDWIEKHEYGIKREKSELLNRIESEMAEYAVLEQLLFTQGDQLRRSVAHAFRKLGFATKIPPEIGPIEDLEISLGDYEAIVEVKGKKTHATLTDLRQLLQYYINKKEFAGKTDVKAIFVVNHCCHADLAQRKDPYVREAIELAEKYDICLLTTPDLYTLIGRYLQGEDVVRVAQETILNGKGYVRLAI